MSVILLRQKISNVALLALLVTTFGCTQAASRQVKFERSNDTGIAGSEESEVVVEKSSTPVDILWVIDNSASMKPSQTKLRKGLNGFARKFLKSGTDIQMAIITTDTFLANEAWEKYLLTPISNSKKTPNDLHPDWNSNYAKLQHGDLLKTKGMSSVASLVASFEKKVSVGTDGVYEEHGFGSVNQFLADNEKGSSPTKLFRKGSQRIIVFLSDEDDQSIAPENVGPEPRKLLYKGSYYTGKDAKIADKILPAQFTIDCPTSVVEGVTLPPMSLCMRPGLVETTDRVKGEFDAFFRELDGSASANPNYFIAAIVGKDLKTIQELRKEVANEITHERGERYLQIVDQVGNGSFAMDIGLDDYSPILNKIGLEIEKRSVVTKFMPKTEFDLKRVPDSREPIVITVERDSTGEILELDPSQYTITENHVKITDKKLKASLKPGDHIRVKYQPGTVLPAGT